MNELLVDRLKHARAESGLKQQEVAEKLGIKANTISNWEQGRTEPDIDTFVALCNIYKIDCSSLLADVYAFKRIGSDISLSEYDHIKKYRDLDVHGKKMVDFTLNEEWERSTKEQSEQIQKMDMEVAERIIPLRLWTYYRKIACAGTGFIFDDIPTDTIEAPYRDDADFIIGVNGESMEPDYHDGEKLYIKKTENINHGEVGVFTINNECFLKEYGECGLVSRNSKYDDIPGSEDVRFIGKVVGKVEE